MGKFRCLTCGMEFENKEEITKHKENNFDHFEYEKIGTKLRLGFA